MSFTWPSTSFSWRSIASKSLIEVASFICFSSWSKVLSRAVGVAVSKGIRLYADVQTLLLGSQELAAANLQDIAADKQLAAAQLRAGLEGVEVPNKETPIPGAGGVGALLGSASLIVAGLIASGAVITWVDQILEKSRFGQQRQDAIDKARDQGARIYPGILPPQERQLQAQLNRAQDAGNTEEIQRLRMELKNLGDQAGQTADKLSDNPLLNVDQQTRDQALKIYEDYKADDLKLVQDHYADRNKIISNALAAEQAENSKYAASVTKVNQQTASSLASAASDFARANLQAEQQYNQRHAQIIRDGELDIEKIREQSQERLRKLEQDHADRAADLTAARDALGLAKENRKFTQDRAEENRNTQQAIRQRRQDIQLRLADLQQSYEQERAQRLADYQARVAEIQAQARQRLAELAQQHQEELQQIRTQKAAKLRELDAQFVDERKRRYQYFLQQIRDLDASLLGETKIRQQYQAKMLTDLDLFLSTYRNKLASLGGPTNTAGGSAGNYAGGYATYGMHLLGDAPGGGPGDREYVIKGDTTRMLERLIGGQITPERLMSAAIYGGGGQSKNVTYNDSRRINSRISSADRERIRQDAIDVLMEVFQ